MASHARVNDSPRGGASVAFADGQLELPAVRALDLGAELVTLSACDTALGRRIRGEGVVGMTHAFLSAGARSVVASLWKVEDRAAADFMDRFYQALAASHPPETALLIARQDCAAGVASGTACSAPSAWAAFILIGGFPSTSPSGSSPLATIDPH